MLDGGITRYCVVCGKPYYCTDGDYFCSSKCDDYYNEQIELYEDEDLDNDY